MKNQQENNSIKPKRDKFKWFVAVLIFLLLFFLIKKLGEKPKNVFESCFEECILLGVPINEDGTCKDGYRKDNNWCKQPAGRCISDCK